MYMNQRMVNSHLDQNQPHVALSASDDEESPAEV